MTVTVKRQAQRSRLSKEDRQILLSDSPFRITLTEATSLIKIGFRDAQCAQCACKFLARKAIEMRSKSKSENKIDYVDRGLPLLVCFYA